MSTKERDAHITELATRVGAIPTVFLGTLYLVEHLFRGWDVFPAFIVSFLILLAGQIVIGAILAIALIVFVYPEDK